VLSIPADPDPPGDEPVTATTAPQAVTFEEAAHDH
jgi:hypothetical protein